MGAIPDISGLISRSTGGDNGNPQAKFFYKDARVGGAAAAATVSGRFTSLWKYDGVPSHGATPGAVAAPSSTTDGGLKQTDPGGGRQKWLTYITATSSVAGMLILYDRLLHISSLDPTSTSAQTVGGSITRYTGAASAGNEIWVEIYSLVGSIATTITASYTDNDGNTGQTTPAATFGSTGFRESQRILRLPLAQGDMGVQAVASITLAGSTTAVADHDFGITIARPLIQLPIASAGTPATMSLLDSPIEIQSGACLSWIWLSNATAAPQIFGNLFMVEA